MLHLSIFRIIEFCFEVSSVVDAMLKCIGYFPIPADYALEIGGLSQSSSMEDWVDCAPQASPPSPFLSSNT